MKKILLSIALLVITFFAQAQFKKLLDRAKEKVGSKTNEKVDKKADDAMDGKSEDNQSTKENNQSTKENNATDATSKEVSSSTNPATIKAYSKFDFVPGEKIIGFEDFSTGNIGDFPAGWNTTAAGEIVTIEGKQGRWLWFTKPGLFIPEFTESYPEDFTFEFDLLHGIPINGAKFIISFTELSNLSQPQYWSNAANQFNISLDNAITGTELDVSRFVARKNSSTDIQNMSNPGILNDRNNPAHISIWRQKERVRVYVNEMKVWDVPKAALRDARFNAIVFSVIYAEEVVKHYIGNLRLAVGATDTRNKMLTQNKWVTHGIQFDVNSATIKSESYGTLKEMANVLKEFSDLKVKIVGHTDGDGNDASNLDLSKRRSASVKSALAKEFGINESRRETDEIGRASCRER